MNILYKFVLTLTVISPLCWTTNYDCPEILEEQTKKTNWTKIDGDWYSYASNDNVYNPPNTCLKARLQHFNNTIPPSFALFKSIRNPKNNQLTTLTLNCVPQENGSYKIISQSQEDRFVVLLAITDTFGILGTCHNNNASDTIVTIATRDPRPPMNVVIDAENVLKHFNIPTNHLYTNNQGACE